MARHAHRDRLPERPEDLDPRIPPVALLDAYQRHLVALTAARSGRAAEAAAVTGARAVAALAIAHAVVADLSEERWPIVRDALVHGARPGAGQRRDRRPGGRRAGGRPDGVGRPAARGGTDGRGGAPGGARAGRGPAARRPARHRLRACCGTSAISR